MSGRDVGWVVTKREQVADLATLQRRDLRLLPSQGGLEVEDTVEEGGGLSKEATRGEAATSPGGERGRGGRRGPASRTGKVLDSSLLASPLLSSTPNTTEERDKKRKSIGSSGEDAKKRKNYVEEKETALEPHEKPHFQCDKCDKSYGSQRSLKQHMTRVHKEVVDCKTYGQVFKKEQFMKHEKSCEKIMLGKHVTKEDAKKEDSKKEVAETHYNNNDFRKEAKETTAEGKEKVKVNVKVKFGDKSFECQMKPEQKMGKLMDQLKEKARKDVEVAFLHNKEKVDPEDMSIMFDNSQIEMVEDKGDE